MDLSEHDLLRLEQYVARRGTAEQLAALERWVASDERLVAIARGMQSASNVDADPESALDEDVAWRRLSRRVKWMPRPQGRRWVPIAAAAALVLAAGAGFLALDRRFPGNARNPARPDAVREVVTKRGERAGFTLGDGTKILLGPESRIRIPGSYNLAGTPRELTLDGEGYFEVTHDSLKPFRVITPLGVAEDLGTEFLVSTYAEVRGMRVVVTAGMVVLKQRHGSPARVPLLTLGPGDLARLDSSGTATASRVDARTYVSWTEGALVFVATPLNEVIARLSRWYDVDIRLAPASLGGLRLSATLSNQSKRDALSLIAMSLNLTVRRVGRTVTLLPAS